jgi:hypothetical protein
VEDERNWKLKLRYDKETIPYNHFTVLAEGVVGDLIDGFECLPGNAILGMKVWASDTDESAAMAQSIGSQIGFEITGNIQIYETDPKQPPKENPYGYDIQFTPFD